MQNILRKPLLWAAAVIAVSLCSFELPALAPNIRPFSPRIQAMGGSFVALADDANALHYNPAGLAREQKFGVAPGKDVITALEVGVRLRADMLAPYETNYRRWFQAIWDPTAFGKLELQEVADKLDSASGIENQMALFDEINRRQIGLGVQGPFNVAYISDGWGFSFNAVSADVSASVYEKILPMASFYLSWATIGKLGYSLPFKLWNQNLIAGVSFKYQSLAYIDRTGVNAISADLISTEGSDQEAIIKDLIYLGQGPGLDWGAIWKFNPSLDFGVSLLNAVSFLRPSKIQGYGGDKVEFMAPILTFGVYYHPESVRQYLQKSSLGYFLTSVKLIADYETVFGQTWSFWKSWHMGTELGLFGKKNGWSLLYLRGGINQGYLTWGLGLDFFVARLDYAYYQQELGPYPGNLRESTHNLSLRAEW